MLALTITGAAQLTLCLRRQQHTACVGLGVFHTGCEVYGKEYAFGGHQHASSGVFETPPRCVPGGARFRESIVVGRTPLSQSQVQSLLRELALTYRGNAYHLLHKNCNHFSLDACERLTGSRPPSWVNRLADLASWANAVVPCLLPASVRALASVPSAPALVGALSSSGDAEPLLAAPPQPASPPRGGTGGRAATRAPMTGHATEEGGGERPRVAGASQRP